MVNIPRFVYWLPTLVWMIVIFGFSSQPSLHASDISWQDFLIKKSAHVGEYFILTFLLYFSFTRTTTLPRRNAVLTSFLIAFLYSCTDEFHQLFIAGREGRVRDVLIDTLGTSGSVTVLSYFSKKPLVEIR